MKTNQPSPSQGQEEQEPAAPSAIPFWQAHIPGPGNALGRLLPSQCQQDGQDPATEASSQCQEGQEELHSHFKN